MIGLNFDRVAFRYRRRASWVLDDFSWAITGGRCVLLGPNGAGKTTLLSIAADALKPDRGAVHIGGLTAKRQRSQYRQAVAWMPQEIRAVPGLTCREQVAYAGWLKGLSRGNAWSAALRTLHQVQLDDLVARQTSQLSGGQLRRIGLAQALVHDAQVLLLDEPASGLDPAQRARFRLLLTEISEDRLVIVATHQVDDLNDLFDSVAILHNGSLKFHDRVDTFLSLAGDAVERRAEVAYRLLVPAEA